MDVTACSSSSHIMYTICIIFRVALTRDKNQKRQRTQRYHAVDYQQITQLQRGGKINSVANGVS
jgi:hypothetical protein